MRLAAPGENADTRAVVAQTRPGLSDWEDLRFFLELYRTGSLSDAARRLGVDHSTVARRIAALETSLDIRLFDRSSRGYERSKAAEDLVPYAQRVEEEVLALERRAEVGAAEHVGIVRLTTTHHLASEFLIPELPLLRQYHPGIELEVLAESRDVSLTRREADIALRLGRPRDAGLVARKIGDLSYAFYASRGHRAAKVDFDKDVFVGFDETLAEIAQERWLARVAPRRRVVFRTNSPQCLLAAARAGLGIAFAPCIFADAQPGLKRLSSPVLPEDRELWLIVHGELRHSPRIRVVLDFIAERAAIKRAQFAGRPLRTR